MFLGVRPEAAACRRVPEEDGRALRVCPVHCQFSKGNSHSVEDNLVISAQ